MIAAVAFGYLFFLLAIGLWSFRRTRNARDFFLAGGKVGFIPMVLATMSSIMSGFVFVGGPGLFYSVGLGSLWITIPSAFTGALMCWLLARPLRERAEREDCLTIPDVIYSRYGCRVSSGLAAVAILVGAIGYLATQVRALGTIVASMLPVSADAAMAIGIGTLLFYTVAGGMRACVYTDVVQGALMLWATTVVFFFALQAGGGLESMSKILLEHQPELIHPWGSVGALVALSWFFVFAVGSLGQPHVVHKFMMVRDVAILRFFPLTLAVGMILCGLIWLGGGMAVKSLVLSGQLAALGHPDDAITVFLRRFCPAWLAALAYAGILSAIMSTVDSLVNVGAATLTRDLPRAVGKELRNEVLWGRVFTLALFGLALAFARGPGQLVAYLGIFGFGTFAAALTPALALGLNWERAGYWSARLSILFGLVVNLLLELLARAGYYSLQVSPAALSLTLSFLVFLLAAIPRPSTSLRTDLSWP